MASYDLVAIGTGTAAKKVALACRRAAWSVAVVDHKPLADTERAPVWLEKEWLSMLRLKQDGVPIVGFTWYSLIGQVDWHTALREDNGNVNELGLFDLDRKIRPVGEAYRELGEAMEGHPPRRKCLLERRVTPTGSPTNHGECT